MPTISTAETSIKVGGRNKGLVIFNGAMTFFNFGLVIALYSIKAATWPIFMSNFFMFFLALVVSVYLYEVSKETAETLKDHHDTSSGSFSIDND